LKWNSNQLKTLTPKQTKVGKKAGMTPYTYESLKTAYGEQNKRNKISPGLGDDIIRLVHDYIEKYNLNVKDKTYDTKRKTRSSTV
jgi:hypothetical protein